MPNTVIILPQSDDRTLCLRFEGAVTKKDHADNLITPMRAMIEKHGEYNLLIWFSDTYRGYEQDAADQSFQTIRELGRFARRIAYINPSARKIFQTNIIRVLLGKDVRNFSPEQIDEAVAWLKEK